MDQRVFYSIIVSVPRGKQHAFMNEVKKLWNEICGDGSSSETGGMTDPLRGECILTSEDARIFEAVINPRIFGMFGALVQEAAINWLPA